MKTDGRREKRLGVPSAVFLVSSFLGIVGSWIPWGDKAGFHGTGQPVPVVIWDQGKDYLNFAGEIENPLVCVIAGFLLYFIFLTARALVRRLMHTRDAPESGEH
jgi:hypothetical protein